MDNQAVITDGLVRGVSYDAEPEKVYLILIDGEEISNEALQYRDWEIVTGRQAAYDYIKNMIESEYVSVDVHKSKIIVSSEAVKVTDGISIYKFMKSMKEADKVIDYTSFDIDDYVGNLEGEE